MRLINFLTLLLFIPNLFGQIKEFNPITLNDFNQEKEEIYKDASAIVLQKDILLEYGKILYVKERIKIVNKEGYDYGTMKINFSKILKLKAFVYNLENGVIEKVQLTKNDIYKENVDGNKSVTKLLFPNIKENSIIEVSYKVENIVMSEIATQYHIPIKRIAVAVENPTYFDLVYSQNPLSNVHLKVLQSPSQFLYTGEHIEPLRKEDYVYNINTYRGKIYIERYYLYNGKKITKWENVAKRFNKFSWFGEELKKSVGIYKKDLNKLIENSTDSLDLLKSIYYHVQKTIKWDDHYSRGCSNIRTIYNEKVGDTGDINFILISMLRKAGFNANPLLLSTKNNGYIHAPTISRFNCVIAAVEIDGQLLKLDASPENAEFNLIDRDLKNGIGLIIYKNDDYKIISMYSNDVSNKITLANVNFDLEELSAKGSIKARFDKYKAWRYRDSYPIENEHEYIENIEKKNSSIILSNLDTNVPEELNKPISVSYDFEYDNYLEVINGDIYFQPLLFFGRKENELKEEKRKYPINFGNPDIKRFIFNFKIPEGYQLKNAPKGKNIYVEEGIGSLKYNIELVNDTIQINLVISVLNELIPAYYYDAVKELFSEHLKISESRIVLTKV